MQRRHRRAHHLIWIILAVLIPLLLAVALMNRVTGKPEHQPVPLDDRAKQIQEANR